MDWESQAKKINNDQKFVFNYSKQQLEQILNVCSTPQLRYVKNDIKNRLSFIELKQSNQRMKHQTQLMKHQTQLMKQQTQCMKQQTQSNMIALKQLIRISNQNKKKVSPKEKYQSKETSNWLTKIPNFIHKFFITQPLNKLLHPVPPEEQYSLLNCHKNQKNGQFQFQAQQLPNQTQNQSINGAKGNIRLSQKLKNK